MTIHSESFIEHLSLYFFRKNYVIYRDIILTRIRNIGLEKKPLYKLVKSIFITNNQNLKKGLKA